MLSILRQQQGLFLSKNKSWPVKAGSSVILKLASVWITMFLLVVWLPNWRSLIRYSKVIEFLGDGSMFIPSMTASWWWVSWVILPWHWWSVSLGICHRRNISYVVYISYILQPWRSIQKMKKLKFLLTLGKLNGSSNLCDLIIRIFTLDSGLNLGVQHKMKMKIISNLLDKQT